MKSNDTATPKPAAPARPPRPLSRLANLATRVISAGDAFEQDLKAPAGPAIVGMPPASAPASSVPASRVVKRTFRFPKSLDSELKRFVHRYNLEKADDEAELTMDEVGAIMALHFLAADPAAIATKARGRPQAS